jgi:small conductance mechanosensitive channel
VIALREITQSALRWAIWLTAIIVALGTLGVDVGALIALLGITGLAISFGAQSFIKDLISYVVFVFADNFRIDEEVLMDGKRGRIQKFEMGSVVLVCRSDDQAPYLVYVPYGKIATVENYSRSLDEA